MLKKNKADVIDIQKRRRPTQAELIRTERFRSNSDFGDMTGARLTAIMTQGERGDIAEIARLYDFIRNTDDLIPGTLETRRLRVRQADVKVTPGSDKPTPDDILAADLCAAAVDQVEDFDNCLDRMLLAHSDGWSFTEIPEDSWRADRQGRVLPRTLITAHPRRFRFDERWNPRLYDNGQKPGPDSYGEILIPGRWIYVTHTAGGVYPGNYGIGRSILWMWLFRRWAQRFWIEHLDRYGSPFTYAIVERNTPENVREDVKAALDSLTREHTAVFEAGGEIKFDSSASAGGSDEQYERYMAAVSDAIARRILGTSDLSSPGSHGSNAAVETRVEGAVDPRTRADIRDLWGAIERDLFRWVLIKNAGLFKSTPKIPIVKLRSDIGAADLQSQALDGNQSRTILEVVSAAHAGSLPATAAREIVAAANPTLTAEQLDRMFVGVGLTRGNGTQLPSQDASSGIQPAQRQGGPSQ